MIAPLLRACLIILLAASSPLKADPRLSWSSDQINVGKGKVIESGEVLKIRAEADGRLFVSVELEALSFDDFSRVGVDFDAVPSDAQFFIAWRTTSGTEGMHQFWLPGGAAGTVSIPMSGQEKWQGVADLLGLGIIVSPYDSVSINSIALLQPSFLGEIVDRQRQNLRDWSAFRSWKPADINVQRGTTTPRGKAPTQYFAGLLLAALVIYLICLSATGKVRKFSWNTAGALLLACWIALDLLWQIRLGQQVKETYLTFAGKSAAEKLMASGDAPIVQFIARVKDSIEGEAPRVFLGSANDYAAMLSAYYIAPLNTYWHRKGPELPDGKFLAKGDYILLVAPYATAYQPDSNTIRLPDAGEVTVERVLGERTGVLLRVI